MQAIYIYIHTHTIRMANILIHKMGKGINKIPIGTVGLYSHSKMFTAYQLRHPGPKHC